MIEKRKVDKKVKKKKKGIIFFIFLMTFFIFIMISFKNGLFNITSIDIVGNKKLSKEQIIRVSGGIANENIFKVNIKDIEINLKKHPYIKEAKVKRKLPDKLVVSIVERREKFSIPYMESYVYSDGESFILRIETEPDVEKVPIIIGINIEKPQIGDEIVLEKGKNIEELESFIKMADEVKLLEQIKSIDFSKKENININLRNGIKVAFGPLNNVEYKLRYLYSILGDVSRKDLNCKYIYFNKGENPIIVTDDK
ncbi:MAG: FtsQ-type POTRA domain-containing protein [Clostridiaceae bacterium]|nr:FtsQ-type POTRA domain-containing protein [Clostridiaceae bacterium]MBW4859783.1 FtsQ-type POTRA domain-containing protein [Clostridiaceae bacterium]MBW4869787.1 FtsQ-type POTRA domain-containing protein [Clostridiaceae bacterium]